MDNNKRFLPVTHESLVLDNDGISIDKKYVKQEAGKALVSTEDIQKLSSLVGYDLPTASSTELGGVKVGSGLVIVDGVLSISGSGGVVTSIDWDNIENKPNDFEPVLHAHDDLYATKDSTHEHDNTEVLSTITADMIQKWDNKSDFDGSYNSLTDKPEIIQPTNDLTDELKENYDKAFSHSKEPHDYAATDHTHSEYLTETSLNDKGYLTEHQDIDGKVDKEEGKSLVSDEEIKRLAGLKNYSISAATATKLGGVKVGDGLTITAGVLSVNAQGASSVEWDAIQDKPESFVPVDHEHEAYATKQELTDALGNIITLLGGI